MSSSDSRLTAADVTAPDEGEVAGGERAFLVVYPDPERAERSRVVELPDGVEVTFGRSRGCTVYIDHDKVSRTHARVVRRGRSILVEDLGSRNGTRVNGDRIEAATRVSASDEIGVGPALAVVGVSSGLGRRMLIGGASYLEDRLAAESAARAELDEMSEKDVAREIKRLEKQMLEHARNLEFEKAAHMRDQLARLKARVFGADGHDQVA